MSGVRVASSFFAPLWQPKHGLARIRPPGAEQAAGLSVRERANKCLLHLCLALFGVLSGVVVAAVVDDDHNTPELASAFELIREEGRRLRRIAESLSLSDPLMCRARRQEHRV